MTKTFWGRHGLHHQLFPKRNPAYVGEDRVHPCVPSLVLAWPARDLIHSVWANYSSIIQGPPKRNHFNKIINKRCTVYVSYKHKYQCTISPTFVDAVWVTSALDRLHPSSIGSVGAVATATTLVGSVMIYISPRLGVSKYDLDDTRNSGTYKWNQD